jgi:hypothetical protein
MKFAIIVILLILSSCHSSENGNKNILLEVTETRQWSQEKFLVHPDSIYSIDLTDINEVSKNLGGFWVSKNQLYGTSILWLTYSDSMPSSYWTFLTFDKEVANGGEVGLPSCQDIGDLILLNDSVHISFAGLGRLDTIKISEMSNEKFTLSDGETYLRHQGLFE